MQPLVRASANPMRVKKRDRGGDINRMSSSFLLFFCRGVPAWSPEPARREQSWPFKRSIQERSDRVRKSGYWMFGGQFMLRLLNLYVESKRHSQKEDALVPRDQGHLCCR